MSLFKQNDFSGGLDTRLDAAKTSSNSYPILVNGRVRRNVISPTSRHVKLSAPAGNYQGLYVSGSFIVIFISGIAYYANITISPITFVQVANWLQMSSTASRIYAEQVPANSNKFNRDGLPDVTNKTFNAAIALYPQALFCFDGVTQPQAILPDGSSVPLGTYASWTKDYPEYVPIGVLPAFCANKLFLVSPDFTKIYSSVSGRAQDFMINIDNNGDKGGDADTISAAVALNAITSLRSLSTGQVLVSTLYGTHTLELDYTNTIFGEPYLIPQFLFPAGALNELSIVDILEDTAFITQSGIHAFNAVAQAKRESNNFPLGGKIRGLITDPITGRSIIQKDTCAILYDDFAFFALNTIHGYGCLVYDTITKIFHSLDLSFGHVKQFANTRLSGIERLFFITHDNEIFEAFADTEKNSTRMYFGEWTPSEANSNCQINMIDMIFSSVRTSGQVKLSVYSDRELVDSSVQELVTTGFNANVPFTLPFPNSKQSYSVGFQLGTQVRSWKIGLLVEWNFDGNLTDISVDGQVERADNVELEVPIQGITERFAFTADSGYGAEMNPGGGFGANGFILVGVVKGERYIFDSNGNGDLVNGSEVISSGVFKAVGISVIVQGSGISTFSLRHAENCMQVLDAIIAENPKALFHGGDFAYPSGNILDVELAKLPLRTPFYGCPGNHDIITSQGMYYFNGLNQPRYFNTRFTFVDIFFMNGNPSEPDGIGRYDHQIGVLSLWAKASTAKYKIVVCHFPPYTNDILHAPGEVALRYLNADLGIHAVLSGHGHVMERFVINSFPYFVCGAGGQPLRTFTPGSTSAFRANSVFGYLLLEADALTCTMTFKDVNDKVLDSYALYA